MGNACCVAARDKMVLLVPNSSSSPPTAETESTRHSPTLNFPWDNHHNRGRVALEDSSSSLTCLSDHGIIITRKNDASDIRQLESAFLSSLASPPFNSFPTHKSPASDLSFPTNSSMDTTVFQQQDIDSTQSVPPSYPYPSHASSFPPSPLSPPSYLHPPSSSSLKLTQLSKQVTASQTYRMNSTTEERQETPLGYDSFQSGPSESWSLQAFSDMMSSSLSYDNDCFGLDRDKIDHHGNRISDHHQQTCGACSRPLSEKSLWSRQKIFMTNELSVSAILACGHVYHGECLEQMTPEIDKFDPSCPICTLGERKTAKLSEKALKVEMDLKARHNKRVRNRVLNSDFVMYDHSHMATAAACKSPELVSSSSVKSYSAKPFLARHFSFGSRGNSKSAKENLAVKKKGFFWTKSSKI